MPALGTGSSPLGASGSIENERGSHGHPAPKNPSLITGCSPNAVQKCSPNPSFLGQHCGKIGEGLEPWTLLPERCFVGNRERGLIPLDEFGDPHAVFGIQEEQGSSPHAWEVRRGSAVPAPRQALPLPLPGSCFCIFVTILKPAARLGN